MEFNFHFRGFLSLDVEQTAFPVDLFIGILFSGQVATNNDQPPTLGVVVYYLLVAQGTGHWVVVNYYH